MKNSQAKNTPSLISINLRGIFAALAFIICFLAAQQASAANYVVTRIDDRNNATCAAGDCSLREAVKAANATAVADTITFNIPAADCNASTNVCTITLTTASGGEIVINSTGGAVTVNGTGANLLTIDGGTGDNRIFYTNQAVVTITGVTLTGGNGEGTGVSGFGGAIYADGGTLVLDGVHVTTNSAPPGKSGGGAYFAGGTNHQILTSTFSANTASSCGGFYNNNGGTLNVTNSTISGNSATAGGGFCSGGNILLRSITVTGNSASSSDGGGILRFNGTLDLGNSIVAGNTATVGPDISANGTVTSSGYNLIGDSAGDSTNTNLANIAYQTSDIRDTPPMLGALTIANGGTTPTHALLTGSPAIDKGFSFGATTDQRGLTRPFDNPSITNATGGDGADIGAFEVQVGPSAAPAFVSGRITSSSGRGIGRATIVLTDMLGQTRSVKTNSFGYYRFDDLSVGETYIFEVKAKQYDFSPQVITINSDMNNLNFFAQ